jgi:arylsulfatase A-like enzyme
MRNRRHRKLVTLIAPLLITAGLVLSLAACDGEQSKPNILLIVLDDFGYNDLAINTGSDSPTPTLDSIAAKGIRFTRHYAESSCTASRATLLTGMYAARVGAHPYFNGIDQELVTLPDALGALGYTSYMIGKWHTGDAHRESHPQYQGFDHWFGFINQLYLRGPHDQNGYQRGRPTYQNPWLETEQEAPSQFNGHLTDILTDRALEVIEQERKPWFMYLSYYAPHTPIEPSEQFSKQFAADETGRYQALKAQLDSNIGRIVARLEDSGELEDTMIIVVSDNGGTAKDWPSNLPFYGTKATYTEGGVRTPLLLRWPGRWPAGQVNNRVAMIFDIYPTILSALAAPAPEGLDGIDLLAPPTGSQQRELRWYSHGGAYGDKYGMLSADGQWRLAAWQGVSEKLFHERNFDEEQPLNEQESHPEIAGAMRASMEAWIAPVTRVDVHADTSDPDWASYSGSAFRRTPLGGTHTMGFVFRRGEGENVPGISQRLVAQEGYIDISAASDLLSIQVDGNTMAVPLPAEQDCFSLVLISTMRKANMVYFRDDSRSNTLVYINGLLANNSNYKNHDLNQASPGNPLRIASTPLAHWYMPATVAPYLSTRALHKKEIEERVDPDLRQACN